TVMPTAPLSPTQTRTPAPTGAPLFSATPTPSVASALAPAQIGAAILQGYTLLSVQATRAATPEMVQITPTLPPTRTATFTATFTPVAPATHTPSPTATMTPTAKPTSTSPVAPTPLPTPTPQSEEWQNPNDAIYL
ncbi:MAG: hypothetical protein KDE54_05010, partial [Caldilineaceae bacterium]|nr:hypothetical protein [Caldilineaceae bacterium]